MPIRYEIDTAAHRVTTTYTGLITPEENLAAYRAYLDDPAANPAYDYLIDLSDIIDIESDFPRVQYMVARLAPLYANRAPNALTAIFAPGDIAFGVARMYQSLNSVEGFENVSIFKTMAEATAWLDGKTHAIDNRTGAFETGPDTQTNTKNH